MKKESLVSKLYMKNLITPPEYVISNTQYEVMMGSVAYGVSNDTSDIDVYGFCIPPHEVVFPYHHGYIFGFDNPTNNFEQYQQHHIKDVNINKEYDITIYNIVKYFQLCMDGNPNMVDSLFVPDRCVLFQTKIGKMVREKRYLFLSKKAVHKFKGYAFSQLHKCKEKIAVKWVSMCKEYGLDPFTAEPCDFPKSIGLKIQFVETMYKRLRQNGNITKRFPQIIEVGYDVKFAYHVVRLTLEIEQILIEGDLDLERNREILKSIRRGEWTYDELEKWFKEKEIQIEKLYNSNEVNLPYKPRKREIKQLLIDCLEEFYGSVPGDLSLYKVMYDKKKQLRTIVNNLNEWLSSI